MVDNLIKLEASPPRVSTSIKRVLEEEAAAILRFSKDSKICEEAADLIFKSSGPLIVSGIGKSGHIAQKIAATFRSLGKPAIFLHAAEASHGDLGLVQRGSVVLVLSNSGETMELSDLLCYCKTNDVPIIGLTGRQLSSVANASDIAIVYDCQREACHIGLAPTTSTTLALAIGDALAIAVSELRGNVPEDFRRYHPGGKLGAHLMTVDEIMHTGDDLPIVDHNASMSEVVVLISEKALGVAVLTTDGHIDGIITDGDLRRNVSTLWATNPKDIATNDPVRIRPNWLISDAVDLMSKQKISVCIVEDDDGRLLGILHIHDCVRIGATP